LSRNGLSLKVTRRRVKTREPEGTSPFRVLRGKGIGFFKANGGAEGEESSGKKNVLTGSKRNRAKGREWGKKKREDRGKGSLGGKLPLGGDVLKGKPWGKVPGGQKSPLGQESGKR